MTAEVSAQELAEIRFNTQEGEWLSALDNNDVRRLYLAAKEGDPDARYELAAFATYNRPDRVLFREACALLYQFIQLTE